MRAPANTCNMHIAMLTFEPVEKLIVSDV